MPKKDVDGLTVKFNLNYIEVPVLAKVLIGTKPGDKAVPHVFAGPSFAFEVGCTESGEFGGASASIDCDDPAIDPEDRVEAKSVDVGAVFGAGVDIPAGDRVTLDARYTMGFSSVIESVGSFRDIDAKNRNISVMAGYTVVLTRSASSGD